MTAASRLPFLLIVLTAALSGVRRVEAADPPSSTPAATAPAIAWGQPSGGLSVGLALPNSHWAYGQDIAFHVHVRNDSNVPLRLTSLDTAFNRRLGYNQELHLRCQRDGQERPEFFTLPVAVGQGEEVTELRPGEVRTLRFAGHTVRPDSTYVDSQRPGPLREFVKTEGWVQVNSWPPVPGRYTVSASFGAQGDLTKARAAGLWTQYAASGSLELTVLPYPFLDAVPTGKVTPQEAERLFLQAATGQAGALDTLLGLPDRAAVLALFRLLRIEQGGPRILPHLAAQFGDRMTPDLVRASQAYEAATSQAAALALGQLGTPQTLEAVEELVQKPTWPPREAYFRGLGQSRTPASLARLGRYAQAGEVTATVALAGRLEPAALPLLRTVMDKSQSPACDEAARQLAGRGELAAVRWLAAHWHWENAAAFVQAPIPWPAPARGEWTADQALAAAHAVRPDLPKAQTRYLDGTWYAVAVSGHPQIRGRFAYAIVSAADGRILATGDTKVLR